MKKRLLSAILALCMILTMMPSMAFAAEDNASRVWPTDAKGITVAGGVEGEIKASDQVWYKINDNTKTLTIGGEGEIPDYGYSNILQLSCVIIRPLGIKTRLNMY